METELVNPNNHAVLRESNRTETSSLFNRRNFLLAMAGGLASVMSSSDNPMRLQSERFPIYTNIHFESGLHPDARNLEDWLSLYRAAGYLNYQQLIDYHPFWNPQVAERITTYSPKIIAIDGLPAIPYKSGYIDINQLDDAFYQANSTFMSLPQRPRVLNPKDQEIYVVRGDLQFDAFAFEDKLIKGTPLENDFNNLFSKIDTPYENDVYKEAEQMASGIGLLVGAFGISYGFDKLIKGSKMTRRSAIIGTVAGLATAYGLGHAAPLGAAFANNEEISRFLNDVSSLCSQGLFNDDWDAARTELNILKMQDSMTYLHMPTNTPAAIVMGAAHDWQGADFMQNPGDGKSALFNYVGKLIKIVDRLVSKYPQFSKDKEKINNSLLDFIARTSILKIIDPYKLAEEDPQKYKKHMPYTDDFVLDVGMFQSPQIEQLLKPYRV